MANMKRRGFLGRLLAGAVVVAASPTALVAPKLWERVKEWRYGYLTPAQADRFMELVLDRSILVADAKVVPMRVEETLKKIRFASPAARAEQERLGIQEWIKDGETPPPKMTISREGDVTTLRPTNQDLIKKAKLSLDDLYGEPQEVISSKVKCRICSHVVEAEYFERHLARFHPGHA